VKRLELFIMASEPPSGIPPRTSSTGVVHGVILSEQRASALGPVSEGEWMGSSKKSGVGALTGHSRNASSVDWTKYKDGFWTGEKEKILLGPYEYMLQQPGKDIRKQLIAAFNMWLKVPPESLVIINKVVAMLHSASLL
jgi:geranylgeranyl diphosphate synthase, type III